MFCVAVSVAIDLTLLTDAFRLLRGNRKSGAAVTRERNPPSDYIGPGVAFREGRAPVRPPSKIGAISVVPPRRFPNDASALLSPSSSLLTPRSQLPAEDMLAARFGNP